MKKILSLFAAVLFAGSMMAEVTLDYSAKGYDNNTPLDGVAVEESGVTFTLDKGTGSTKPAYYTAGTGARTYGGNTLTVDAGELTMTSIVFTFTQNNKDYTVDAGSYVKDDKTWTGSAKKVVFTTETGSGHNRIKAITVFLDGEGPTPVVYDTLTVAQAIEATQALDSAASSKQEVYVEGYVVYADPFSPTYSNQTFFMSDDPAVKDSTFEAYGASPKMGDAIMPVADGDKVRAFGFLKKYYDKNKKAFQLELANPKVEVLDTVPGADRRIPETPTLTVAEALEIGGKQASGGVTAEEYKIEGYVSYIDAFFSEDFKNETFYISDDKNGRGKENAFEIYRGKPNTEAEVGLGAKVSIKCKIKNYNGIIENDGSNVPCEVVEASTFVPQMLTVDEAVEIALTVSGNNVPTPDYYVVKGYVNNVTSAYTSKYNNATFTMAQFPNETEGALKAYQANILKADSNNVKTVGAPSSELYVYVMGYLTKYNSAAQIVKGSHVAFVEVPKEDTIHVNVAEAIAAGLELPIEGKSEKVYAVTGFVNIADPFDSGIQTFNMADDATSADENFLALDAEIEVEATVGKKVELVGRLQNTDGVTVMIENGKARIIPGEGIENIVLTEKAQKVAVDGQLFIIRDGKMYNAQGAQVR